MPSIRSDDDSGPAQERERLTLWVVVDEDGDITSAPFADAQSAIDAARSQLVVWNHDRGAYVPSPQEGILRRVVRLQEV